MVPSQRGAPREPDAVTAHSEGCGAGDLPAGVALGRARVVARERLRCFSGQWTHGAI